MTSIGATRNDPPIIAIVTFLVYCSIIPFLFIDDLVPPPERQNMILVCPFDQALHPELFRVVEELPTRDRM